MIIGHNRLVLVILLGVLLQGCSSTPRFNDHFGATVRANLSAQVIDPAATASTDHVSGVDGVAARAAYERYQRSFKENDTGEGRPLIGGSGTK